MTPNTTTSTFLDACRGNNTGQIPLWIMRQAGRYLQDYLDIRKKVSFLELCRTPELIAEVVRQPVHKFGFDAAILFSDILIILEPMGATVTFPEGGPRLDKPIETPEDVERLTGFDIKEALPAVFEGIKEIKKVLPDTPLIGFAGSPFTIACYLIEGKGSKTFDKVKRFIHMYPEASEQLFALISDVTADYLAAQIDAGAQVVQLFDSWGGILAHEDYAEWSAKYANRIFGKLKDKGVPRILFVNNVAPYLDIVNEVDCEVVGIDYRINIAQAMKALPNKAIQGNLDPTVLFGAEDKVRARTRTILESVEDHNRFIFNLGHGILPKTPVSNVQAVVDVVHSFR